MSVEGSFFFKLHLGLQGHIDCSEVVLIEASDVWIHVELLSVTTIEACFHIYI